jgi:hypothetical protein
VEADRKNISVCKIRRYVLDCLGHMQRVRRTAVNIEGNGLERRVSNSQGI